MSDGVTPGAIQVPANGQPIVLLADGQTVGGYPKIATVISADLPRLAHLRPGTRVHFEAVSHEAAHRALQDERERWQRWLTTPRDLSAAWHGGRGRALRIQSRQRHGERRLSDKEPP